MKQNYYSHKVTIGERRRENKRLNDAAKKSVSMESFNYVFNNFYRDQAKALYRAISKNR